MPDMDPFSMLHFSIVYFLLLQDFFIISFPTKKGCPEWTLIIHHVDVSEADNVMAEWA